MRFYPLGSSSLNQLYNTTLAVTASISSYAASASYGVRVLSASYADARLPGLPGAAGTCSYSSGSTGDIGLTGIGGPGGGVSVTVPKPA